MRSQGDPTVREKVVQLLRSILTADKFGINLDRLNREYRDLVGKNIPFRDMGHGSLEEFLDQGQDFCRISRSSTGDYVIHAIPTKTTVHMSEMVARQSTKKKKSKPKMPRQMNMGNTGWKPSQGFNRYGATPPNRGRLGSRFAPTTSYGRPQVVKRVPQRQPVRQNGNMTSSAGPSARSPRSPPTVTSSPPMTSTAPLPAEIDFCKELEQLCLSQGLPNPSYTTSKLGSNKFVSTAVVGSDKFKTYPKEFTASLAAERGAAKLAIDALKSVVNKNRPSISTITPEVVKNIIKLIDGNQIGLWSTKLEKDYAFSFGESLPPNWPLEAAKLSPSIKVHKPFPDSERFILSMKVPGIHANGDINAKESRPQTKKTLPNLTLPQSKTWNVYVTNVLASTNVLIRLLGADHSVKYEEMKNDLELFYFDEHRFEAVKEPEIGQFYVVKYEDEWHRVRLEKSEGVYMTVFMIDTGDSEVVTRDKLKELDDNFMDLPAQAYSVSLFSLEEDPNNVGIFQLLEQEILGKSFVAEIVEQHETFADVILHDTSSDEEINVNKKLRDIIYPANGRSKNTQATQPQSLNTSVASDVTDKTEVDGDSSLQSDSSVDSVTMDPELAAMKDLVPMEPPGLGQYFDVLVTLAASPSHFYVQSWGENESLELLTKRMTEFYDKPANIKPLTREDLARDRYFAAQENGRWIRVYFKSALVCGDSPSCSVFAVDHGHHTLMDASSMQVLWSNFRNLPAQAINAKLSDVIAADGDWTPEACVNFSKTVVNKPFVAIIKSKKYQPEINTWSIGVSLIDTSHPDKDVYIDKALVDSKSAVLLVPY